MFLVNYSDDNLKKILQKLSLSSVIMVGLDLLGGLYFSTIQVNFTKYVKEQTPHTYPHFTVTNLTVTPDCLLVSEITRTWPRSELRVQL